MTNKILDDLIAAGVPSDTIIAVAELIAAAKAIEGRREKNRDRMRSVRTRARTTVHTDAHTRTQKHTNSHILEEEKKEEEEKEKKETQKAKPLSVYARTRGTRLTDNWQPSEVELGAAKNIGLSIERINAEAARFRDYWLARAGSGGTKADWSATWRNWCRNALDRKGDVVARPAISAEPVWMKPPPGCQTHEEILASVNGQNHDKTIGTEARSGSGMDEDGADRQKKLQLSG